MKFEFPPSTITSPSSNEEDSATTVDSLTVASGGTLVVVDGAGGLQVGSSSGASKCDGNVGFNANAANNLRAYGTAGIVQNSFREIVASD